MTVRNTFILALSLVMSTRLVAVEDLPRAVDMFPAETQAFVWMPSSKSFLDNWAETELGKLAADERLKEFWASQQEEISNRFSNAGWQLSVKFDDLPEICSGQAAMGWISRPSIAAKPYSLGLVVDVAGRDSQVTTFLDRIQSEMDSKKATTENVDLDGLSVKHYVLPKLANDTKIRDSYYVLSKGQLLAADDLETIKDLVKSQSATPAGALSQSNLYKNVQSKIERDEHPSEIEYFVQPIGFGKLLRSVSGKQAKSQVDILKLLEGQGFDRILCAAGSVQLNKTDLDMHHQGFILREEELPVSVQILDFPNQEQLTPPSWISANSAGVLGFSWNFSDAFPKFKGIVDAYIGDEQFDEILDGIKRDPNGPQIDIKQELLPYIGTEFYAISEVVEPITPESKRSLICIKLRDPDNKLTGVLNRYSKSEPGASTEDIGEYRIWKFSNEEEKEEIIEFNQVPGQGKEEEEEKPLLSEWAVSIVDGYFVFASNPETLTKVIANAQNKNIQGEFERLETVQAVRAMQKKLVNGNGFSFSEVDLADRSFEMQYELFRQGILPQSRSLLALVLERILKTDKSKAQELQGNKLPPFEQVKQFFTTTGMAIRTEKDGWGIDGFILGK
ncbi:MAG: hypothetical protein FJ308_00855 [Planctomycetes bacterium]|nr:hypothetical protein [Planctomycetota bacterium]